MKHRETHCDCGEMVSPLSNRWRCSVCGKSAIMHVAIFAAVCDGESFKKREPEGGRRLEQGPPPEGRRG